MITQYRPSYYQSPRASAYCGRSIDTKPIHVENGSTFKEIDTGRVFRYDKENNIWIEQKGATPVQPAKPEQAKTVDLNMATGNQTVTPDSGKVLTSVTVTKPDTLVAENIKSGVDIGGVAGILAPAKAEQVKTVDLAMAAGNQTISPDSGKVLSSAVVTKPTTLIAGNIKKGVNIGGVIGTLEEGTSAKEPYIEETYDSKGNLTEAAMHGYTRIRNYAFYNCSELASTSLPSGITAIGDGAFENCSKLALTSLPTSITAISSSAFQGCSNLALASLPTGITSIGAYAFYGCSKLALTSLPSGITSIAGSTFQGCPELALTSLPSGITLIDNYAFYGCTKLALASLPIGVTSIGSSAFYGCTGLTSIKFEGTPTKIASDAFNGCTNLTDIKVPWAEGAVANAPWGATNATITYNYTA